MCLYIYVSIIIRCLCLFYFATWQILYLIHVEHQKLISCVCLITQRLHHARTSLQPPGNLRLEIDSWKFTSGDWLLEIYVWRFTPGIQRLKITPGNNPRQEALIKSSMQTMHLKSPLEICIVKWASGNKQLDIRAYNVRPETSIQINPRLLICIHQWASKNKRLKMSAWKRTSSNEPEHLDIRVSYNPLG